VSGVEVVTWDKNIADAIPAAAAFFAAGSRQKDLSDGSSFIVRRVQLDPADAACSLGIVQRLLPEDSIGPVE
jgi:hypothetical protein